MKVFKAAGKALFFCEKVFATNHVTLQIKQDETVMSCLKKPCFRVRRINILINALFISLTTITFIRK